MSVEQVGRSVVLGRSLPWSKTHKWQRSYRLTHPAVVESTGQVYVACLVLRQGKTSETYFLDLLSPDGLPPGWRKVLFVNQTTAPTPDRPGIYAVHLDAAGVAQWCDCTGSKTQRQGAEESPPRPLRDADGKLLAQTCKHKDVCNDLSEIDFWSAIENPAAAADLPTLY